MFRISKLKNPQELIVDQIPDAGGDQAGFDKFCITDHWTGDLSNGLFQLGRISQQIHGLATGECGLLTLLRAYDAADRVSILELLENASSSASSFCFSTHIVGGPGERQPLLCVGESSGFSESATGRMHGVFVFPRMPAEIAASH